MFAKQNFSSISIENIHIHRTWGRGRGRKSTQEGGKSRANISSFFIFPFSCLQQQDEEEEDDQEYET